MSDGKCHGLVGATAWWAPQPPRPPGPLHVLRESTPAAQWLPWYCRPPVPTSLILQLSTTRYTAGVGGVIKGWDQGCLGMKLGEVRQLTIPADEGYGASGFPAWGIPPNGGLYFGARAPCRARLGHHSTCSTRQTATPTLSARPSFRTAQKSRCCRSSEPAVHAWSSAGARRCHRSCTETIWLVCFGKTGTLIPHSS